MERGNEKWTFRDSYFVSYWMRIPPDSRRFVGVYFYPDDTLCLFESKCQLREAWGSVIDASESLYGHQLCDHFVDGVGLIKTKTLD